MSDQLASLIGTTIVAIVVTLVHAYLTRGSQQTQQEATKEAITAVQEANTLLGTTASASGGGSTPVRCDVLPWLPTSALPVYGQLTQTLPSGSETETWYNDCGETCCSMIIRGARGVYVPADELRVLLRGQGGNPLTDADALVAILAMCNVKAHSCVWGVDAAIPYMQRATADGLPLCTLGTWPTPGGVLHWLLVYGVDTSKVFYINPWSATKSWLNRGDWASYSANSYVLVDSHLLYH